ncbi:hypothetical protein L596_001001 [Steinernema carpocapsae]|uniref:Reverse transcriptase domain-containing protein n=1 Tax=Steinernema carpocapsae TaxID=34508 RepID=A0A4U8UL15_STECR|nr:hypothetical protein L596_001001 [Steinernema carpocapsae]
MIAADIKKAFHQIELDLPDRDLTHFYWIKDVSKPLTEDNLLLLRFCRVPFGFVCSLFLLAATVDHHLENHDKSLAAEIRRNVYSVFEKLEDDIVVVVVGRISDAKGLQGPEGFDIHDEFVSAGVSKKGELFAKRSIVDFWNMVAASGKNEAERGVDELICARSVDDGADAEQRKEVINAQDHVDATGNRLLEEFRSLILKEGVSVGGGW